MIQNNNSLMIVNDKPRIVSPEGQYNLGAGNQVHRCLPIFLSPSNTQLASGATHLQPRDNSLRQAPESQMTWPLLREKAAERTQGCIIPLLSLTANVTASVGQYGTKPWLSMLAAGCLNAAYGLRAGTQLTLASALKHRQGQTSQMPVTEKVTYFARIIREVGAANSLFILSLTPTKATNVLIGVMVGAGLTSALAEETANTINYLIHRPALVGSAMQQREILIQNLMHQFPASDQVNEPIVDCIQKNFPINEDFNHYNKQLKTAIATMTSLVTLAGICGLVGLATGNQNAKTISTLAIGGFFQMLALIRPWLGRESNALQQSGKTLKALNQLFDSDAQHNHRLPENWQMAIEKIQSDIRVNPCVTQVTLSELAKACKLLRDDVVAQLQPQESWVQQVKRIGTQVRLGPGISSVFMSYVDRRPVAQIAVSIMSKLALLWTSTGDPLTDLQLHRERKAKLLLNN